MPPAQRRRKSTASRWTRPPQPKDPTWYPAEAHEKAAMAFGLRFVDWRPKTGGTPFYSPVSPALLAKFMYSQIFQVAELQGTALSHAQLKEALNRATRQMKPREARGEFAMALLKALKQAMLL